MKRGFTLVELLVVISIISLLASIVLSSLSSVRARSRDAARIGPLEQLRNALELYHADHGRYPKISNDGDGPCSDGVRSNAAGLSCLGCVGENVPIDSSSLLVLQPYLSVRPGNVYYKVDPSGQNYKIATLVENGAGAPSSLLDPEFAITNNFPPGVAWVSLASSETAKGWSIGCNFPGYGCTPSDSPCVGY